jgi:hypothetical protein
MTLLLRMHGSLSSALWIYDLRFTICCCGDWVSEFMVSGQRSAVSYRPAAASKQRVDARERGYADRSGVTLHVLTADG